MLIDQTNNFETRYHLDRLIKGRTRVNIEAAHNWYANAIYACPPECVSRDMNPTHRQLVVFAHAVVANLFEKDGRGSFPETFYLDQERLQSLQIEIDDIVCFDICLDLFDKLAEQLGRSDSVPTFTKQQVRTSLTAIMGEALGYGPQQWLMNSEALSLELLRQASRMTGSQSAPHFDHLAEVNLQLRHLLIDGRTKHVADLKASFLPQVIACIQRYSASSPLDLYNNLVSTVPVTSTSRPALSRHLIANASVPTQLDQESAKVIIMVNRLSHIILLHWRIWKPIAYHPDETSYTSAMPDDISATKASSSPGPTPPSSANAGVESQVPTSMRTGEPRDPAQETHVTHQASSQ